MNAKPNAVSPFKIFLFALCCLLSALPSLWARSNAAIQAFNNGVKAFNAKQFNEAIPLFDDAIANDSDFAEAYFARGACKYYLKSLDGALLDISDALRIKPDYLDARALRGAINYESDRWDEALEDFNAVLTAHPDDAQSLLGRAVIELKREKLASAQRDFKGFLRARPDDPLAPKVKELLASIRHASQAPVQEEPSVAVSQTHASHSMMTQEQMRAFADSLLGHSLSESYDRKVLRGENAQAVGDIHSVPGVPHDQKASDSDVQIVEPR